MNFKALVKDQNALGEQIDTLVRNFKKDPKDRKTSAYYTKRLQDLTKLAEEFHKNHKALIAFPDAPQDDYFESNYYNTIQATVDKYMKLFESEAMKLIEEEEAAQIDDQPMAHKLRKILRNQRALMTALTKTIDDVLTKRDTSQPPSYYNIKANVIEKYMIDLTKNNAAMWELTDDDKVEDYTLQAYYELAAKAEEAMIELQQHMHIESSLRSSSPTPPRDNDLRLPRITLPKFDGSYQRWMEFKDLFLELIHNTTLSEAKKMHYLTTSLEGEPKNLIKHLPAIGTNYATAWSIISSRYENKRLLVSTLLNKLMTQSSIKKESAAALKSLHDVTKECIHGLKAQGIPVQHWDAILSHIVLRRMDTESLTIFEQGLNDNRRLVTIDEVLKFLERRFQSFEAHGRSEATTTKATKTCASVTNPNQTSNCQICKKEPHKAYACKTFSNAELNKKWKWVKDLNLCVNCLGNGHRAGDCKAGHCTKTGCTKNHHTLLHNSNPTKRDHAQATTQDDNSQSKQVNQHQNVAQSAPQSNQVSLLANNSEQNSKYVLLGTARIRLLAANGQHIECRAILDAGSQVNLITDRMLKKLGGKPRPTSMHIEGVGASETQLRHQTTVCIYSALNDFKTKVDVHIIRKIVSNQPTHQLDISNWAIPQDIILADPEFSKPGRIDCLLGAEVFFNFMKDGQVELANNLPILQNTVFGWMVAGKVDTSMSNKAVCGICTHKELEAAITKFWESEEIPDSNTELTEDELRCESHLLQHTFRANDGRFVVRLPLKNHTSVLADSKGMAYERFKTIERRLTQNPELKEQYVAFMREYEALGHMTRVNSNEVVSPSYFIPHHCILRPEKTTTKLRVVFDASAHKPSGPSLNDIMFNGPRVQSELFSILLRFRMHKFALKTDMEKMYRQIWVHKDDRNLQLILWRENPTEPMKTFQLNTVTYGTRAAPYLATRCLSQLAHEMEGQYPYGAKSLKQDFYVDDGLIGADTIHEALAIQQQLISILSSAGMKLRKWCANHPQLLSGIAPEDQEVNLSFGAEEDQSTKTLGLSWLPKSDMLYIKANGEPAGKVTKRIMSSDLAHIYDPLGLVGPVIVTGKIQLQRVWQLRIDWDEELPIEIERQWTTFKNELPSLEQVKIPRHVFGGQGYTTIELHAFADASERAFGAAIYIRTIQGDKTVKLNLLCSKSRVAPIKVQTIPRLELCAALLAAELMTRVQSDLGLHNNAIYFWTDSQIVLSWIHNNPGRMPVYVAHRIAKVLQLTIADQWRHVPSKQNPADVLSRGLKPREFSACSIWLYGPLFLYQPHSMWPAPFKGQQEHADTATILVTNQQEERQSWIYEIPTKNSFLHVQRVVAYILRFARNVQKP